jgi:threonylcarbamoyladenosine tRNA methylthiotransferase MtaB
VVIRIDLIPIRALGEQQAHHLRVTFPSSKMECARPIVRGINIRTPCQQHFNDGPLVGPRRRQQRRRPTAKIIVVDMETGSGRGIMWALVYRRMDQAGISREKGSHGFHIPESAAHKDVVLCATRQQQTTDIMTFADGVLRRGAAMINVPDFQLRPVVEEERSDLRRLCDMQGRLAVTATGIDEFRLFGHHFFYTVQPPKTRCGVDIQPRALINEVLSRLRVSIVQDAEAAGPPLASCIDVCTVCQQNFQQRAVVLGGDHSRRVKNEQGRVDLLSEFGVSAQQRTDTASLAGLDLRFELFDRVGRERIDMGLEPGPARETILAGKDELRLRQCQRRIGTLGQMTVQTRQSFWLLGLCSPEQFKGLMLELLQAGSVGQGYRGHADLLSHTPDVRCDRQKEGSSANVEDRNRGLSPSRGHGRDCFALARLYPNFGPFLDSQALFRYTLRVMPTAAFANLGCKVNQYETERIAESFEAQGFTLTDFREPADVYVINTCSVTADADRKSRHMARKAARQKDGAKVVLTGCFSQMALDTGEHVDGATLLIPNAEKMRTAAHVLARFPDLVQYSGSPAVLESAGGAFFPESAPGGLIDPQTLLSRLDSRSHVAHRTRATLKIQDGCRYFCAFCSIPYTRNAMASRPLTDLLTEARQMAEQGVREIVVTGVCVGAYGPETGSGGSRLADVLVQVADIPGIARVRLSSVQPVEIPDAIIDALATHPNIAPHLHLSLQSGDDTILAGMNRPYDTRFFAEIVEKLRKRTPRIGLTTDLIVGFPGETRELFENTLAFAEQMRFARTHVFRYSPRQRTAAADRLDDVPHDEKERRHRELTALCVASQKAFAQEEVGKTMDVLVEAKGAQDGWLSGYTGNYIRVQFAAPPYLRGRLIPVQLTDVLPDGDAFGVLNSTGDSHG